MERRLARARSDRNLLHGLWGSYRSPDIGIGMRLVPSGRRPFYDHLGVPCVCLMCTGDTAEHHDLLDGLFRRSLKLELGHAVTPRRFARIACWRTIVSVNNRICLSLHIENCSSIHAWL